MNKKARRNFRRAFSLFLLSLRSGSYMMGMLSNPLLHLDREPEAVDTEGNDGQEHPLNVVAEELTASAVECELLTVDVGVLGDPALLETNGPRSTEAESEHDDQAGKNVVADHTEKSAGEFGFHNIILRNV
jgi:hypothetical protein